MIWAALVHPWCLLQIPVATLGWGRSGSRQGKEVRTSFVDASRSSFWGIPRHSRTRWDVIPPACPIVSSQLEVVECLHRDATWSHLNQMPEPLQLTCFNAKEQWFCTEHLLATYIGNLIFFQSLPKANDHSVGLEHRSGAESRTLPSGSAPPTPRQSSVPPVNLQLTVFHLPPPGL